jgi:hypothetical protein
MAPNSSPGMELLANAGAFKPISMPVICLRSGLLNRPPAVKRIYHSGRRLGSRLECTEIAYLRSERGPQDSIRGGFTLLCRSLPWVPLLAA